MKKKISNLDLSVYQPVFDFDNTITSSDILDDVIKRFSVNKRWLALEKDWEEGRIGSKECLEGQLRSVKISKGDLLKYLSGVKIDPYFHKLFALFKKQGISPVILSDSFSFLIENILFYNGLAGLKVYSNSLRFENDKLRPLFKRRSKDCFICAHCKKNTLLNSVKNGKIIIYIGDGLSDVCPAQHADLVFAKDKLLEQLRQIRKECVAISDLGDVYGYLKEVTKWPKSKRQAKKH